MSHIRQTNTSVLRGSSSSFSFITRNTFCGTQYLPHSRVHKSMAKLCSNIGDSAITKGQIAFSSLRMRETPIFLLPVKNLTPPSCSPTTISYNMKKFSAIRPQVRTKLHIFFSLRMHETVIFLLQVENLSSPLCSPTPISYKI